MQKKNHSNVDVSQRIRKTIGKTKYDVSIHFSKNSTENAHDKLKRIIINDYMNGKKMLN